MRTHISPLLICGVKAGKLVCSGLHGLGLQLLLHPLPVGDEALTCHRSQFLPLQSRTGNSTYSPELLGAVSKLPLTTFRAHSAPHTRRLWTLSLSPGGEFPGARTQLVGRAPSL